MDSNQKGYGPHWLAVTVFEQLPGFVCLFPKTQQTSLSTCHSIPNDLQLTSSTTRHNKHDCRTIATKPFFCQSVHLIEISHSLHHATEVPWVFSKAPLNALPKASNAVVPALRSHSSFTRAAECDRPRLQSSSMTVTDLHGEVNTCQRGTLWTGLFGSIVVCLQRLVQCRLSGRPCTATVFKLDSTYAVSSPAVIARATAPADASWPSKLT